MSLHIVFFIYGLAFFIFGFSIMVYPKREAGVDLARDISLLAAFGLLHGANEWVDMLLLDLPPGTGGLRDALMVVRTVTVITSFLCLLAYGVRVIVQRKGLSRGLYAAPVALVAFWTVLMLGAGDGFFTRADIFARYLLGLPGIVLTAYALSLNIPEARERGVEGVEQHLKLVIWVFVCYAFFAGLVVPEAGFFPANALNYRTFSATVGLPVQIFRAACAVTAAYGILWVLRVFTWRTRSQLEHTRNILERLVDERTSELRALNEELEHEVAEKTEYEHGLVESLQEKEALLQELHHRVKNNMQIMASLMRLESRLIDDPAYARMFAESTKRLNTMITIQERLYTTEGFGRVEFTQFMKGLSRTVFRLYNVDANRVRLSVDAEGLSLLPDTIVPVGMVVHELMTNSIKHGFAGDRWGDIYIFLSPRGDDMFELVYRDTGIGLPEGFDMNRTDTLGLELVKLLCTDQLHGTVAASNGNGAIFTIRFRELKYRERI